MPELPEVETMRRGLLPIVGCVITKVEYPDIPYRPIVVEPSRDKLVERCQGQSIQSVDRIAKRVLVRLGNGDSIVMQPKMAGIAMLSDPPSQQHTRVVFQLTGNRNVPQFLYWDRRGLGTVSLWTAEQVLAKLGPDVLGPDASIVEESIFVSRFRESKKEIKVAMLDQSIVAGIGNLYAAEILFAAKVHPQSRCGDITTAKWKRVHAETIRILQEAIEKEGSTLSDGTYRNAINGEGRYQNLHQVYDRENQPCKRCSNVKIIRMVQAQRSTFFCPKCQQQIKRIV
jgi:formamidopyrimidine-DNA glycosylase